MDAPTFITVKTCAKHLDIGYSTVARMVREGDIPALRLGGRWLIPRGFLEELQAQVETGVAVAANPISNTQSRSRSASTRAAVKRLRELG